MFEAKKFSSIKALDGISEKTMTEHYKLYEGYVKKANEIMEALKTVDMAGANQTYSQLRELKVELSFALGGIRNHEAYFGHLGGTGGEPSGKLAEAIVKEFGSFAAFKEDMSKTAIAARGWVWLAYDWQTGKLFNFIGDAQNTYGVWDCSMLVALDTYEHAYWIDFGSARASYVEAFWKNMDWGAVEKQFEVAGIDKLY